MNNGRKTIAQAHVHLGCDKGSLPIAICFLYEVSLCAACKTDLIEVRVLFLKYRHINISVTCASKQIGTGSLSLGLSPAGRFAAVILLPFAILGHLLKSAEINLNMRMLLSNSCQIILFNFWVCGALGAPLSDSCFISRQIKRKQLKVKSGRRLIDIRDSGFCFL